MPEEWRLIINSGGARPACKFRSRVQVTGNHHQDKEQLDLLHNGGDDDDGYCMGKFSGFGGGGRRRLRGWIARRRRDGGTKMELVARILVGGLLKVCFTLLLIYYGLYKALVVSSYKRFSPLHVHWRKDMTSGKWERRRNGTIVGFDCGGASYSGLIPLESEATLFSLILLSLVGWDWIGTVRRVGRDAKFLYQRPIFRIRPTPLWIQLSVWVLTLGVFSQVVIPYIYLIFYHLAETEKMSWRRVDRIAVAKFMKDVVPESLEIIFLYRLWEVKFDIFVRVISTLGSAGRNKKTRDANYNPLHHHHHLHSTNSGQSIPSRHLLSRLCNRDNLRRVAINGGSMVIMFTIFIHSVAVTKVYCK